MAHKRGISHLIFYSKYSPKKAYIKRTLGGKYSVHCVGTYCVISITVNGCLATKSLCFANPGMHS